MRATTRFSLVLSLLLAGLLTLALAACGNDDDSNGEPTPATTPTEAAGGNGDDATDDNDADDGIDDAATDDEMAPTPDDGNDDGNGDPLDAIRRATEAEQQTMSVIYEMEFSGELMTVSVHSDPPRYAFGLSGTFEGETGSFLSIYDGTDSFLCTSDAGEEMCMKFEGEGADDFFTDDLFFFLDREALLAEIADDAGATLSPAPGRSIAGHSADCWQVSGEAGEEGIVCISNDSDVLLLVEGNFDGEDIRMEVVDVNDRPSDSEFEPPYEVMDFSAFD